MMASSAERSPLSPSTAVLNAEDTARICDFCKDGLRLEQVAEVFAITSPRPHFFAPIAREMTLPHSPDIAVYPARSSHLDELSDVLTRVFHPIAGLGLFITPFLRAGVREDLKRRMHRSASQYRCLGAWQNARLIGTVEIGLRRAIGGDRDRRYPYIANLAVLPQYRRCGAARKLLSTAENIAETWGCPDIYLHVMDNNRPARKLYHQMGYRLWRSRRTVWTTLGCPRQLLLCKHL